MGRSAASLEQVHRPPVLSVVSVGLPLKHRRLLNLKYAGRLQPTQVGPSYWVLIEAVRSLLLLSFFTLLLRTWSHSCKH
jgi:hypothetical protein